MASQAQNDAAERQGVRRTQPHISASRERPVGAQHEESTRSVRSRVPIGGSDRQAVDVGV
jgi:hypothetical protein